MNKKIRLLIFIVLVIILVFFLVKILNVKKISYKVSYNDVSFEVKENHEKDYYYFEIKSKKSVYPFRLSIKSGRKLINRIYYYNDKNYECILPMISDEIYIDMMCYSNNILYNYSEIRGIDSKLDTYVDSISEYNVDAFSDSLVNQEVNDGIYFYNLSLIQHIVYISTYKGIINNKKAFNIFDNDVYDNEISLFFDKYYISANYNDDYEFQEFYVINLENQKISKIKSKTAISFDSYIQGIVENKVYLYDRDNEIQYEIDISKRSIKEISSTNKIRYYDNGSWTSINKPNINKKVYFNYENLNNYFTDYDKVIETENYFYLLKKEKDHYKLYRADTTNYEVIKFISNLKASDINYNKDYIYYIDGEFLIYYSDTTGKKTILKNSELVFNKSIKYYIY